MPCANVGRAFWARVFDAISTPVAERTFHLVKAITKICVRAVFAFRIGIDELITVARDCVDACVECNIEPRIKTSQDPRIKRF